MGTVLSVLEHVSPPPLRRDPLLCIDDGTDLATWKLMWNPSAWSGSMEPFGALRFSCRWCTCMAADITSAENRRSPHTHSHRRKECAAEITNRLWPSHDSHPHRHGHLEDGSRGKAREVVRLREWVRYMCEYLYIGVTERLQFGIPLRIWIAVLADGLAPRRWLGMRRHWSCCSHASLFEAVTI